MDKTNKIRLLGDVIIESDRIKVYNAEGIQFVEEKSTEIIYGPYIDTVATSTIGLLSCIKCDNAGIDLINREGHLLYSSSDPFDFGDWVFNNIGKLCNKYKMSYGVSGFSINSFILKAGEVRVGKVLLRNHEEVNLVRICLSKEVYTSAIYDSSLSVQLISPTLNRLNIYDSGLVIEVDTNGIQNQTVHMYDLLSGNAKQVK